MNTAIIVLIVMAFTGVIFGFVLAYANGKFVSEVNPLIHVVDDILPKGQCGACGFAGCQAYAEAVVMDSSVAPNLCIPGKEVVALAVAKLTNKEVVKVDPQIAHIKCAGSFKLALRKYKYQGIADCIAASLLEGGSKVCQFGCLGLGTCVKQCPFDAMTLSSTGLPIINRERCTGCGKCESVCPKNVIQMIPVGSYVCMNCNSLDKGSVAMKNCSVACIGCGKCSRACPHGAISIINNLAIIDSNICIQNCKTPVCITQCPTAAIESVIIEIETAEEIYYRKTHLKVK